MRVLIDTCVVIDFLQQREPFAQDAKDIFRLIATEEINGFITVKSLTDIYYLTHRNTHNDKKTRHILNQLLSIVCLLDSTADDALRALSSKTKDFEDAMMIETGIRSHMDCVLTRNIKDYVKSTIPVFSPNTFIEYFQSRYANK